MDIVLWDMKWLVESGPIVKQTSEYSAVVQDEGVVASKKYDDCKVRIFIFDPHQSENELTPCRQVQFSYTYADYNTACNVFSFLFSFVNISQLPRTNN